MLQSPVPLCNTHHPLTPPARLSPICLGPLFCLFQVEGVGFLQAERQRHAPLLVHGAVIHWVWTLCHNQPFLCLGTCHPARDVGVWPMGNFLFPLAANSRAQGSSRNTTWFIYMFIQQVSVTPGPGRALGKQHRRQSRSLCPWGA